MSLGNAPVAFDDEYSAVEDELFTIAAPGVLGNDLDLEGNPLTAELVEKTSHGDLTFNAEDGSFTYLPYADFNGVDSFIYVAKHGKDYSNRATVTITVHGENDAPVAVDDYYSVDEDSGLVVDTPGVLANDTDPEGDKVTATPFTKASHGELETLKDHGYFVYVPDANFNGVDSFTYRVTDGMAGPRVATVTITVNAVNDAPVAGSDSYSVHGGDVLVVDGPGVLANDTDVEGDPLTATCLEKPAHGSLEFYEQERRLLLHTPGQFQWRGQLHLRGLRRTGLLPEDRW